MTSYFADESTLYRRVRRGGGPLTPPPPPLIQRLAESLRNFWPDFKPPYPLEKILRTPLTLYIYNYLISLMKNYDINAYNRKTDI